MKEIAITRDYEEMELELDESYAEKTKRDFQKKVEGKKREAEKRANKMGRKVSKL